MPAERARPEQRGLAGGRTWTDPYGWLERLEPDELRGLLRAEDHAAAIALAAQAALAAQLCAEFDGRADRELRWHGSGRYQIAVGPDTETSLTIHRRDRDGDGDGTSRQVQVPHGGAAGVAVGTLAVSSTGTAAVPVDQDGSERYRIVLVDFDTHTARWIPEVTCTGPVVWNRRGTALYLVEPAEDGPDMLVRIVTGTGRRRVLRRVSDEDMLASVAGTVSGAYVRYEEYSATVSRTVLIADDADEADDAGDTGDAGGAGDEQPAIVELAAALDGDDYSIDHVADTVVRLDYRAGQFLLTLTHAPGQDGSPCWVSEDDEEVSDFAVHPGAVLLHTLRDGRSSLVVVPIGAAEAADDRTVAAVQARRIVVGELEHVDLGTGDSHGLASAEVLHQSFLTRPQPLSIPFHGDHGDRTGADSAADSGAGVGGLVGAGTWHEAGPYRAQRFAARARDGAAVPVTLLGRADRLTDPDAPLLLFAYGAYGESVHALYTPFRMALFDRGIRMAVLHVRGGGELGEPWHAAAVAECKPRSIEDFDDCVGWLFDQGLARPGLLLARGRSAGAFTVCGAVNLRPAAYRAVVLEFPFVDPLGGLTDPAAPHLAQDFEEWGDPSQDTAVADALLAHAPLRTLPDAGFPPSLLYSAWNDQQVQPWQALKLSWAISDGGAPRAAPLLRLLDDEGHAGPRSAAADAAYEAELLAFLIHAARATEPTEPADPAGGRLGRAVRT